MVDALLLLIPPSILVAWMVGADSVSPSLGPAASSGFIGVLQSTLLAGLFGLLGAVTQGGKVAETIGSGIITGTTISTTTSSIILLISALLIAFGVFSHIPVPTVFAVVGSVIGAGIGLNASLNIPEIQKIVAVWIATPFLALFLGFFIQKILKKYLEKRKEARKLIGALLISVGSYSAYTGGANHVGLAVGLLYGALGFSHLFLLGLGGFFILIGAWIGGPRIINAVSKDYSEMGPRRAISALGSAAAIAQVATLIGVPISFNEAIIFAVIGSGSATGTGKIQPQKIFKTILTWTAALLAAIGLTWMIVFYLI